jgi:uncharacterized protein (DUF2062 family)
MWPSRKKLREIARRVLHTHDTPKRTALAFALGAGIAFCPLLGFHYLIGFILAFAFGLNRLAVFTGVTVNNPYTFVPITALCAQLGALMIGQGWLHLPVPEGADFLSLTAFWAYLEQLQPLLLPFYVGSTTLSVAVFTLTYFISLPVIKRLRQLHPVELLHRHRPPARTDPLAGPSSGQGGSAQRSRAIR